MITAAHAVLYADDPEQARAFFRDVLGMPNVDIHGGWLIFKLPPAELGVHPSGEGVARRAPRALPDVRRHRSHRR